MRTVKLDVGGVSFGNMRFDMNVMLQKLLGRMDAYGTNEASMTVKINVTKTQTIDGPMVDFEYKISNAVQVKEQITDKIYNGCELERSPMGEYYLRVTAEQTDMFGEGADEE